MGSMIFLRLGKLELDAGKNGFFVPYHALFQEHDLAIVDYEYANEIVETKEAYCRSLGPTINRLELLGYTLGQVRAQYEQEQGRDRYPWQYEPAPFDVVATAVRKIDARTCKTYYADNDDDNPWRQAANWIATEQWPLINVEEKQRIAQSYFGDIRSFDPLSLLRLLAENPNNADCQISWEFADVVEGGYVSFEEIRCRVPRELRFLIVTEGSSDSTVIERALTLLRPEVRDFFDFIDMDSNYPLTGVGHLHNFYQGLLKINVLNQVLIIYDNDTQGTSKFLEVAQLDQLPNVRVMKLPDLASCTEFLTSGPTGEQISDINGRAVAIECFLDLHWQTNTPPRVRWTSYDQRMGQYQGELENKSTYLKRFLSLAGREPGYDFTKINILLDRILEECTIIAEER